MDHAELALKIAEEISDVLTDEDQEVLLGALAMLLIGSMNECGAKSVSIDGQSLYLDTEEGK